MSVQVMRRTQYSLVLALLFAGSIPCGALAADRPKSKDDLDPESRQRFEQLREQLRQASQKIEDAKRRAYAEDPLLVRAKEGIERSRELASAAGKEKKKVDQFLAGKAEEIRRQYKRWQLYYGDVLDYELVKTALQDPKLRPLYSRLAEYMLEELRQRESSKILDSIRNEMPPKNAKITPEQALTLYLRMLERHEAEQTPKLAKLEKQLSPPAFMREYVKEKSRADALFLACDTYSRLNMPEYVARAEKEAKKTANELIPQMDKLWPGWAEAEMRDAELLRGKRGRKGSKQFSPW